MIQQYLATFSTVMLTMVAIELPAVQAAPVTYDFTVVVTEGSLSGNTFSGSFSYDDAMIEGVGTETVGVEEGLKVNMNFLGEDYTETADIDYPKFPRVIFEAGEIQRLDYWIEPGERGIWWGLPGWEIELSPRN
ncbi:MAG: hypothetical protein WBA77_02120 [Microcoleaceae cyanobacterium]